MKTLTLPAADAVIKKENSMFTEQQKSLMFDALNKAKYVFAGDAKKQHKISIAHDQLRASKHLSRVSYFVCDLHLQSIAISGFDLHGEVYRISDEELPQFYVLDPANENGEKVVREIAERHPNIVKQRQIGVKNV